MNDTQNPYKEGDKSQSICEPDFYNCGGKGELVSTTFKKRDYTFRGREFSGVLVAVCDVCDQILAIPAQSAIAMNHAIDNET